MAENRLLVVGYGGAGKRFVHSINIAKSDCDIEVINTSNSEVNVCENKFEFVEIEAAKEKRYDAVLIAVPTSEHINYLEEIIDVSDIFLLEKPIDSDFSRIEGLAYQLEEKNKKVYVYFQKRFLSSWTYAKELIESGKLGEFKYGRVLVQSNVEKWRDKDYKMLYVAKRYLGGGATLTECHEIDFVQWILGDITEVTGVQFFNNKEIDVDDSVHYIAKIGEKPISFQVDMMSQSVENEIEFVFTNGSICINTLDNKLTFEIGDKKEAKNFEREDSNNIAIKAFMDYLYEGKEDKRFVSYLEAMKSSAVCKTLADEKKRKVFTDVVASQFPKEGVPIIRYVVKRSKELFGDKIIAIYGMGSLGYDGYIEGWSDLDIDIIVDASYEEARELFNLGKKIEKEIQKNGYERIDIRTYNHIHLNQRKTILSFGQCSRAVMLIDSSRLIYGTDISNQVVRPSIQEMNKEAWSLCKTFFDKSEEYWEVLPWDDAAAFYALIARFIYSSKTGKVGGKKVAIEYFLENSMQLFPEECRSWFIWAYALRIDINAKNILLVDCIKKQVIQALREAFRCVYDILSEEIEKND